MSDEEVSINDLIEPLQDTNEYGDLKQMASHAVEPLKDTSHADAQRAALSAAYEVAKENVSAWAPVVTDMQKKRTVTFEDPTADVQFDSFTPIKTEFGSEIETILKEEKLTRDSQEKLEDESLSNLSEEQIREKLEHLARLRSIQFYNEQKAKRWKKIKSKAFRRIHKRERGDLTLEELAEIDPEALQNRLKKIEADRAKERTTLRHKNTSQWVRRVLSRGLKAAGNDVRQSYEDQLKLGEELTKKIQGPLDPKEEAERAEQAANEALQNDSQLKGLFNMKFMKDAEARKEAEAEKSKNANDQEIESSGIVTIKSDSNQTFTKIAKTDIKVEIPEDAEPAPAKKEEEKKKTNIWLNPNQPQKKKTRFVNAGSFHQPTEAELKKLESNVKSLKVDDQQELLAEAIGYTEEFQKEKEAQALKDAQKDLADVSELHLQGWGSWVGPNGEESEGAKRHKERSIKKRNEIISQAINERKDKDRANVILSEGSDPATQKYSIPELPKQYTNAKQLQAQLKFNTAPETNSVSGFMQMIKPEIEFIAGQGIEPIGFTKALKVKRSIASRNEKRKNLEESKKGQNLT